MFWPKVEMCMGISIQIELEILFTEQSIEHVMGNIIHLYIKKGEISPYHFKILKLVKFYSKILALSNITLKSIYLFFIIHTI
jgi:hypothetical protein